MTDREMHLYEGFLAGLTAYAAAVGHSCLMSENPILKRLADEAKLRDWKQEVSEPDPPPIVVDAGPAKD